MQRIYAFPLCHPPLKRDNSAMDRRNFVYYNQRTPHSHYIQRRKKQAKISPSRILPAIAFVSLAFIGQLIFLKNKPTDEQVLSAQTDTTKSADESKISNSPLKNVPLPTIGQSAIGTLEEGLIHQTENETQAPIASITKIITSLVLLEKRPLQLGEKGKSITFTDKDLQYFNGYYAKLGTVTAVTVGDSMSQYEALQSILLPSSNNMADTMVDRYFSNMEEYIAYANNFLRQHGLQNTVVADASGFSPDSKSTPSDLIKLGQLALQNPVIKEIVAQKSATVAVAGDIPNYNALIYEQGVIGIKPGATDEAGYCLLFAAELPDIAGTNHTLIAVTVGHPDRPEYVEAAKQLLEASREAYLANTGS